MNLTIFSLYSFCVLVYHAHVYNILISRKLVHKVDKIEDFRFTHTLERYGQRSSFLHILRVYLQINHPP